MFKVFINSRVYKNSDIFVIERRILKKFVNYCEYALRCCNLWALFVVGAAENRLSYYLIFGK